MALSKEAMLELVKQKETEGSLRQEFEQTLTARVGPLFTNKTSLD